MRFTPVIFLCLTFAWLASCEVSSVAPNAGDVGLVQDRDHLVTDREFAPRVVNILPFESCALSGDGEVTEDPSGEYPCAGHLGYDVVSKKTHFSRVGLRFLIEFDKKVYYDSAMQGQIGFINAVFIEKGAAGFGLQPVEIVENVDQSSQGFEEVVNPNKKGKYRYFTTRALVGSVLPLKPVDSDLDQGPFEVIIPDGLVYDVNPSGKRIHNLGDSREFNYDNVLPTPELVFEIEQMNEPTKLMSASADDLDGRSVDFSSIKATLDWGETVYPTVNMNEQLNLDLFEIDCRGCPEQPYARGKGVGARSNTSGGGSGVREEGFNKDRSEYYFTFIEDDRSGDLLAKLATGISVTFDVYPWRFEDMAGNSYPENAKISYRVNLDNARPSVNNITVAVNGEERVANSSIIGIGSTIDFTVEYYLEQVIIPRFDEYGIELVIGANDSAVARLIRSQRDKREYRTTWNFRYTINEGDGDNAVGVNAVDAPDGVFDILGEQYTGASVRADGTVETNWESDISMLFGTTSNFAFDRVLWSVTDFVNKSLYGDVNDRGVELFRSQSGRKLNNLQVDGIRPAIETDTVSSLSKLLSGTVGVLTSTVTNGTKLAIAIPFTEALRNPDADAGINFASMQSSNPLRNSSVIVTYCSNAVSSIEECDVITTTTFDYDQELTQAARDAEAIVPYRYRTIVYAKTVDASLSGIRSVVAEDLIYPFDGNEESEIGKFTDHARNSFDNNSTITSSDRHGISFSVPINIAVEGGAFVLRQINLVERNEQNQDITVLETSTKTYSYNRRNRDLYIEAIATRDFLRHPGANDATLTIEVSDNLGNAVDVTSSTVSFKLDADGNQARNTLVFYFDLKDSFGLLSDYDGITVKALTLNKEDSLKDELGLSLGTSLDNVTISPVLAGNRIKIDTHAPQCDEIYITGNADARAQTDVVRFGTVQGYTQTLRLVLECDQALQYNHYKGDPSSDIAPIMPISFDTLDFVMEYDQLANDDKSVVFDFAVIPGLYGNGDMHMGADGIKTVNWHLVAGTRLGGRADAHQFFTDEAGNALDLAALALYDDKYIFKHNMVLEGGSYGSDIVVDTRPYPLEIVWPDPAVTMASNYSNNGATWISGNSPTNNLAFSVRYGYYLNGATVDSIITLPIPSDVSGDYQDASDNVLFSFSPFNVTGASVNYRGTLDYGTHEDVTVDAISNFLTGYVADSAPYASHNLTVVNANGIELDQQVISNVPVNPKLLGDPGLIQNTFPTLLVNNSQPQLNEVRIYVDIDADNTYNQLSTTGNNGTAYFGNIYVVAVFTKQMNEDELRDTYVHLQVTNTVGENINVDSSDIFFQKKADLNSAIRTLVNNMPNPERVLVYNFVYADEKYKGSAISINVGGGTDFIREKTPGALGNLRDPYGNTYLAADLPEQSYEVALDARSDIETAEFKGAPYFYDSVIKYTITTKARIDVTQLRSRSDEKRPNPALAQRLKLKRNEPSSDFEIIRAYALDGAVISDTTPDDGSTTITFEYSLYGLTNQFNADTISDHGLQPLGRVEICNIDGQGVDASTCDSFVTTKFTADGGEGATAILSVENPQDYAVQVASKLNRLVLTDQENFTSSGVFDAFQVRDSSVVRDYNNPLGVGDELIFTLPVAMLNEQFGTHSDSDNSLRFVAGTSSSRTQLVFSLYNGVDQRRVTRLADFHDLDSTRMRFTYTIESGDLVHIKDTAGEAVDYQSTNGTVSADDLALRVNTVSLFDSAIGNRIDGITDTNIGNPVWSQVVDASNEVQQLEMDTSNDMLTIDTRPKLVSARATSPTIVRSGQNAFITLVFDQEIYANGVELILTDLTNDVTANLGATSRNNEMELPFEFVVTAALGSPLYVKGFNLGSGYVRMQNNIAGNTSLGINTSLDDYIRVTDLTVDNVAPKITDVRLVDNTGAAITGTGPSIYSKSNGNGTMRLQFTIDKDVTYDGVNTADAMRFRLNLDQHEAGMNTNYPLYLHPASNQPNSLIMELDVANNVADNVQDIDGLKLTDDYLSLLSGTIKDAGSGLNLVLALTGVKPTIEGLDVSIDNKRPYVQSIEFSSDSQLVTANTRVGRCRAHFLCAGANAQVDLTVDFNEPVSFSTSTPAHYTLKLVSESGDLTFDATPVSLPGGFAQSYLFRFSIGSTAQFNNETFTRSLIATRLVLAAGAKVRDRAENIFNDNDLSLLTGTKNINNLAIDAIGPRASSASFSAGEFGNGAKVVFRVKFDKKVTVNGTPSITDIKFHRGATSVNKTFVYAGPESKGGITDHASHEFDFTVDAAVDSNDYDGASYPSSISTTVTDFYGNQLANPNFDGAGVSDGGVKIRPQNQASIHSVTIEQANGQPVATLDNTEDYIVFISGDKVVFKVTYDRNVRFSSATVDTEVHMLFRVDGTTDSVKANYTSGTGTRELEFELPVIDGYEDSDGITLVSDSIQFNSGGGLEVVPPPGESAVAAPVSVVGAFQGANHANANKVLPNVRMDTQNPLAPQEVTFVLGDTTWGTGSISTKLRITKSTNRAADTIKYRIKLFSGNNELSSQYVMDIPDNVDYPGAPSVVYAAPDASGNVTLTIPSSMLSGDNCKLIYAQVFAVDQFEQVSNTGVFSADPSPDPSNDFAAALRLNIAPTLNTVNASGKQAGDVEFSNVESYPIAAVADIEAASSSDCANATLTREYSISDASGDFLIAREAISNYNASTGISIDKLIPWNQYTTTFYVKDELNAETTSSHTWIAFSRNMPVRYDLSSADNLVLSGDNVVGVTNLGSGATVQQVNGSDKRTVDPALWNLQNYGSILPDKGYSNVVPEYSSTSQGAVFPPSASERAVLYFDHDEQEDLTDTAQNRRVDIASNSMTMYLVFTPPAYNATKGNSIIAPSADQAENGLYQSALFLGVGGYYGTSNLNSLGAMNTGLSMLLDTDGTNLTLHNNTSEVYTFPQAKTSSKQLLVYQITSGSGAGYILSTYLNDQLLDNTQDIQLAHGLSFDKLYLGAVPHSPVGKIDPLQGHVLMGHSASGMQLHELVVYDSAHTGNSRRTEDAAGSASLNAPSNLRQAISYHLAEKWNLALYPQTSNEMQVSVAALDNQRPNGPAAIDGVSLTCAGGASSNAAMTFPVVTVSNLPSLTNSRLHLVIEQNRAGALAGNLGNALLLNLAPSANNVIIDATNSGGVFTNNITGASGGNWAKPFSGLCHQAGENLYTFGLYLSEGDLAVPSNGDLADTIAEFEQHFAGSSTIRYRKYQTRTRTTP